MISLKSFSLLAFSSAVAAYKPCPLLGPVFPAPTGLSDCNIVQDAFTVLQAALDNATASGMTPVGSWASTNNSFSIGIFSTTSDEELFSYQWSSETLQKAEQGVTEVTKDSVYRVGSLSKLITAYLFMINAGPQYWDKPITKYIPELKSKAKDCSAADSPIDCTDWGAITLGSLASHMAGVNRDYSTPAELLSPMSLGLEKALAIGLPPVNESVVPPCGLGATDACDVDQYIAGLSEMLPVFAPFTSPVYSQGGYILLAAALERITGRTNAEMAADLFSQLGMDSSSYSVPESLDNAVIPLGINSGFQVDIGVEIPAGGYYSTQSDLVKLGKSMLSSSILSPVQTRQWMKPVTFTEASALGMPWEIYRIPDLLHDHSFDLYTKTGDVLDYSSHLLLAEDWNIGIVILAAGNDTTTTRTLLAEVITTTIFPALEYAARRQAQANYAGTYTSSDSDSIELVTQAGKPGLKIASWTINGTDTWSALFGEGTDVRMYPTNLKQDNKTVWRAIRELPAYDGIFSSGCDGWFITSAPTYGNIALDEIVFDVEDGKATAITPRAWRKTLQKSS
jgi:CubicO group peptidase (beta-lactamase class C family)